MKNKFKLLIFSLLIISCNSKEIKKVDSVDVLKPTKNEIKPILKTELNFKDFKNTKWIVGEVGLNGEKPDTIMFDKPNILVYISNETGQEILEYSFSRDTLIYISNSTEFDIKSNNDIKCEIISKLIFQDDKFKYIYLDKKCSNEKTYERINMEENNIFFKKVK
jgi:hypothetical protein